MTRSKRRTCIKHCWGNNVFPWTKRLAPIRRTKPHIKRVAGRWYIQENGSITARAYLSQSDEPLRLAWAHFVAYVTRPNTKP